MSESIAIVVSDSATEKLKKLSDPAVVLPALAETIDQQNNYSVSHIQRANMSLPPDGPTSLAGLRVISNRLRGSLRASKARIGDDGIVSSIGSNVVYAAIQEFGGDTKPHVIEPRNGKALRFGGKFFRRVNHPGSHIEGRHFVRRGLEDRSVDYTNALEKTIFAL